MKVIGFSGGAVGRETNTDRLVKAIMEKSGYDTEFIKLTDLNYTACKGCVEICAKPQECLLEDDLLHYFQKVKEADAVVIGSPVRFGTITSTVTSFIDRFWGYRHVNIPIQGKPFVLALCGSAAVAVDDTWANRAKDDFHRALRSYRVNVLDVVIYSSKIVPCYGCGRHQECVIGGAYRVWGEKARTLEITPELFHRWEDEADTVAAVEAAAAKLRDLVPTPVKV